MGMPISVSLEIVTGVIKKHLAKKQHPAITVSVRPYHHHPKMLYVDIHEENQGGIEITIRRFGDGSVKVRAKSFGCLRHFGDELATLIANILNKKSKPEQVET